MSKLTDEAKKYAAEYLEAQGREAVVQMLEGICIACYDDEDLTEDLIPAAVDSIEAGDIEIPWDYATARATSYAAGMAWLDVDDVWAE